MFNFSSNIESITTHKQYDQNIFAKWSNIFFIIPIFSLLELPNAPKLLAAKRSANIKKGMEYIIYKTFIGTII